MAKQVPYNKEKPQDIHANNLHILKDNIKSGNIGGTYIFYGDEEYTKNHYSKLLTSQAGSNLNVTCIYESEFNLPDFLSACETSAVESMDMFSMFEDEGADDNPESSYRVIKLFSPKLSVLSAKDAEYFIDFLKNDLPEKTIVIFWFHADKEEDLSKGLYKSISEFALTVNFRRENVGSSVLITWILRHFSKEKINVDRHVAVHLCQTVGNSMMDLKNEIDKLIDYLRFEDRDTLETRDVDYICIKSAEAQIFDITNGILAGDFVKSAKALTILRDKHDKRFTPVIIAARISGEIYNLCKVENCINQGIPIATIAKQLGLFEFVVKRHAAVLTNRNRDFQNKGSFTGTISRLCLEYGKKLKSSRTDGYELLLELIFKLSYAGKSIS